MWWCLPVCFKSTISEKNVTPEPEEEPKPHIYTEDIIVPQPELGSKPGFIYILREREFLKTNEQIYKIGKTVNMKNRMPSYPKDTRLYLCFYCCSNIDAIEKHLISTFDIRFVKRTDIGSEYYEGDIVQMLSAMMQYCLKQQFSSTEIKFHQTY